MTTLPSGLSPLYWRFWTPPRPSLDVTQSLPPGEDWIASWPNIGLYEGNTKISSYQTTTCHLTTHNLIIIPDGHSPSSSKVPTIPSIYVHLRHDRQTEFYAGFMRSSAKITLNLGRAPREGLEGRGGGSGGSKINDSEGVEVGNAEGQGGGEGGEAGRNWTCGVCGFVNPLDDETTVNPRGGSKCSLCGVGYTLPRSSTHTPIPASRGSTPTPTPTTTSKPPQSLIGGENGQCPACTFLNHPSLSHCEICSTPLPGRRRTISKANGGNVVGNDIGSGNGNGNGNGTHTAKGDEGKIEVVRLSFRSGGEKEGYRRLKNVLSDKSWERKDDQSRRAVRDTLNGNGNSNGTARDSNPRGAAGIDGILQSINLDAKAQTSHLTTAFQDLEILMVRAGEMVKLAQSLNTKLTLSQSSSNTQPNEEESTLIRTSLVQLGLPTPALTLDMVKGEKEYFEGLARELGVLLTGGNGGVSSGVGMGKGKGLMVGDAGRGVIGLDEVWGLWMRARGVALLPPSTLISTLPYLPSNTQPPINILTLPSSLQVLHTPHFSPPSILSRTLSRLSPSLTSPTEPSLNILEFASYEDLPIGLAKEMMESIERVEEGGVEGEVVGVVRDEGGDTGVRWFRDLISIWRVEDM